MAKNTIGVTKNKAIIFKQKCNIHLSSYSGKVSVIDYMI